MSESVEERSVDASASSVTSPPRGEVIEATDVFRAVDGEEPTSASVAASRADRSAHHVREVLPDDDRPDGGSHASGSDILSLLRQYRSAEATMRRESRRDTTMGETDLVAVRLIVAADAEGRHLTPGTLSNRLGISTASTTALIDRLAAAGFVERRPHASDRRSIVLVPTVRSEEDIRDALGRIQANVARVADDMSQDEMDVVARFLTRMITAARDESSPS